MQKLGEGYSPSTKGKAKQRGAQARAETQEKGEFIEWKRDLGDHWAKPPRPPRPVAPPSDSCGRATGPCADHEYKKSRQGDCYEKGTPARPRAPPGPEDAPQRPHACRTAAAQLRPWENGGHQQGHQTQHGQPLAPPTKDLQLTAATLTGENLRPHGGTRTRNPRNHPRPSRGARTIHFTTHYRRCEVRGEPNGGIVRALHVHRLHSSTHPRRGSSARQGARSKSLVSYAAIYLHAHACAAAALQFLRSHAPQPVHGAFHATRLSL